MKIANVLWSVFLMFWMSSLGFSHQMNYFKPETEPNGFGDIQWETELSALKDMKLSRVDPSYGGIDIYLNLGEA